jgi:hypothetical protein
VDPRQQEDGCFLLTPACDCDEQQATATGAAGRRGHQLDMAYIHCICMGPPPRRALTIGHHPVSAPSSTAYVASTSNLTPLPSSSRTPPQNTRFYSRPGLSCRCTCWTELAKCTVRSAAMRVIVSHRLTDLSSLEAGFRSALL